MAVSECDIDSRPQGCKTSTCSVKGRRKGRDRRMSKKVRQRNSWHRPLETRNTTLIGITYSLPIAPNSHTVPINLSYYPVTYEIHFTSGVPDYASWIFFVLAWRNLTDNASTNAGTLTTKYSKDILSRVWTHERGRLFLSLTTRLYYSWYGLFSFLLLQNV